MGPPGRSPAAQSVRPRDSYIPAADAREPFDSLHLEGSLFDSVASVALAYGMKIALTPGGKIRLPCLIIPSQGGFREKD